LSLRRALLEQAREVDVVERLDHRPPETLGDPGALGLPLVDRGDPPVAARVVVAGVDHDHVGGDTGEEILRQVRDRALRDRDDHDLGMTRSLRDGDGAARSRIVFGPREFASMTS
jgi:hypothetical protein